MSGFNFTIDELEKNFDRFHYQAFKRGLTRKIVHGGEIRMQMFILIDSEHDLETWRETFHLANERISQEEVIETDWYKRDFDYDQILFYETSMSTVKNEFQQSGGVIALVAIHEITPQLVRDLKAIPHVAMVHVND